MSRYSFENISYRLKRTQRHGNFVYLDLATFIPSNIVTLMAAFATGTGIYFFFQGVRTVGRMRSLKHARASAIRDAALGSVAVSGMVTGPHTLTAPISGNACFLYRTTVWEQRGKNQPWRKVANETLHLPFFVTDSTGQLLVEPFNSEIHLQPHVQQEFGSASSFLEEIPPRVSIFLSRHGVAPGRPIRIEERSLRTEM